jgi:DSHCT (NUC185) domain
LYAYVGIGLHLKNGMTGYFLGDVKWGNNNSKGGFGMILNTGDKLLIVNKEHIKSFGETDDSILLNHAQELLHLIGEVSIWNEESIVGCKRPVLIGQYDMEIVKSNQKILDALNKVVDKKLVFAAKEPGSLVKQRMIIKELEEELSSTDIAKDSAGDLVLDALKYAVAQKDPVGFVNSASKSSSEVSETFAWKMFKNVMGILQEYKALDGTTPTTLGQLVGSLSADNELWLAIVLQRPSVIALSPPALAAVMCGVVTDGFKASNAFFRQSPSEAVNIAFDELQKMGMELTMAQGESGIEFPVNLCRESGGLIEQWAGGANWRDLCKDTSLDQGDVCRMLRRTVEVLRQIPMAYGVNPTVAQTAYAAAAMMDRFPVADFDPNVDTTARTAVGYGVTGDNEPLEDIEFDESMYEDDEKLSEEEEEELVVRRKEKRKSELKPSLDVIASMSDYNLDDLLDELELK